MDLKQTQSGAHLVVLGASGLVGSHVIELLSQAPWVSRVYAITRRPVAYENPSIENWVVDFDSLSQNLHSYLAGIKCDALFSCLGTTKSAAGSIKAQRVVDYEYQKCAAEIAANNAIPHYLLVSSIGAAPSATSSYLKMKGELERDVKTLPLNQVDIFNPSLLLGARQDHRLAEGLGAKVMPWLTKTLGLHKYRPIQAHHLAQAMVEQARRGYFKPQNQVHHWQFQDITALIKYD